MDSDERSGEESEVKSQNSENSQESNEEANKSDEEDQKESDSNDHKSEEANNNSIEESEKKPPIKFDNLQLVLTNEVKIDVISKEEIKNSQIDRKESGDKYTYLESKKNTYNTYNLLNEVNNDLDELFSHLSRTIKTFNETQPRADSPVTEYKSERNYSSKGVQSPPEIKKNFSEKETNTTKPTKTHLSNQKLKNTPNFQVNRHDMMANNINNINYKYTPKNNYMRTVDDLYRHRNEPIIYSSSHRVNKKNYAGESDGFESRGDYQKYKPKDIIHAMDILLDKDD